KSVNEFTAMQMTAVYSCVRILAEAVAGIPLHLYKYTDTGGKVCDIAFALPPVSVYIYKCSGNPSTASASIRTHEYTAVICIAVNSLTDFPLLEFPKMKL